MLVYLQHMIQLILSPARGWEDVASHSISGRHALTRGLLPLMALAGLSVFGGALYEVHPQFGKLLTGAVACFVQYFLTYYLSLAVLMSYLPRITADGATDENRVALFLCFAVGMMCVIGIVANLLPMTLTLVEFLPLYVAVVMYKGRDFLNVKSDVVGGFVGVTVLSVIVPVYLIGMILARFI